MSASPRRLNCTATCPKQRGASIRDVRALFLSVLPTALALKASAAEGFQGHSLGAFLGSFLSRDKNERKEIWFSITSHFMPISLHAQRNRRKKCAGVSPLDPTAERILEMRSGNIAIKKQRASVTTRTEALWVGSSTKNNFKWWPLFCLDFQFALLPQAHCNELKNTIKGDVRIYKTVRHP